MSNISKERVATISDGVIAVAATLLVLELKVPEGAIGSSEVILHWSRLMAAWLISLVMIATVWFDNHLFFEKSRVWTVRMTVATFTQLAVVSLIPFICSLAVEHYKEVEAVIAFNAVMLINGAVSVGLSLIIASANETDDSCDDAHFLRKRGRLQIRIYLAVFAIAIAGAFVHRPFLGVLLWGLCPLFVGYFLKNTSARNFPK